MVRLRKHRVVKDEDDYYTEELTKAAEVPMSVPKEVFDAAIKPTPPPNEQVRRGGGAREKK